MAEGVSHKTVFEIIQLLRLGGAPSEAIDLATQYSTVSQTVELSPISRARVLDVYGFRSSLPKFYDLPGSEDLLERVSGSPSEMLCGTVLSGPQGAVIVWLDGQGTSLVAALAVIFRSPTERAQT